MTRSGETCGIHWQMEGLRSRSDKVLGGRRGMWLVLGGRMVFEYQENES